MAENELWLLSTRKLKRKSKILKISSEGTKGAMIGRIMNAYNEDDNFTNDTNDAGGAEMELILDCMSDIEPTVMHLQQNMYIMQPQMFEKFVSQTYAPRYSSTEQQQFIDTETARIMTEREEQKEHKKQLKMDDHDINTVSSPSFKAKNDIRKAYKEYEKDKGYKACDVQSFMTYCKKKKNIKKSNWSLCREVIQEIEIENKKRLWNEFAVSHNKYIESDCKENGQSLQIVLQKLRKFAMSETKHCIDGLLHCKSSSMVIVHFLSCLEIKDDTIRECVVMILSTLYDVSDDNFIAFTNANKVIEYLSKSLMVSHANMGNDNTLKLTPDSSARVDMKILQVLAVNFAGKELLYHTVFNHIKEAIMSPYQHIDFIEYALGVISTIIQDAKVENALKWINCDCVGDMNMDHTVQFAVYTIQSYPDTEADELARIILLALHIDINKALIDFGMVENVENDEKDVQIEADLLPLPKLNMNNTSITSPIQIMESTTTTTTYTTPNITLNPHAHAHAHTLQNSANMQYSPYMQHSPYNMSSTSYQQHSPYIQHAQNTSATYQQQHSPYNMSAYQQQYAAQYYQQQQQYAAYYQQQQQQYNKANNLFVNTPNQYNTISTSPRSSYQSYQSQASPQAQAQTLKQNIEAKMQNNNIKINKNVSTNSNKLALPKLQRPALRRISSDVPLEDKIHSTLRQLLLSGSVMTKYPSIHTDTPNYLQQLVRHKCKDKLVRMSQDWINIEFHNISHVQQSKKIKSKPPRCLPIHNIRYIHSSFSDNQRIGFSKSKQSQELLIYSLDSKGKEIVIKLICQSRNHAKRWTIAINQIIKHFNQ